MKFYVWTLLGVIVFTFLLLQLPNLVVEDTLPQEEEQIQTYGRSSEFLEKTKYETILQDFFIQIQEDSIEDISHYPLVKEYLLSNVIVNKQHTIAQELVALYAKEDFLDAQELSTAFFEENLQQFDEKQEWYWRNYGFYIVEKNGSFFTLYEHLPLLLEFNDSSLSVEMNIGVRPYEYQVYEIDMGDGETHRITTNLFTKEVDGNLSEYIDFETKQAKQNFSSIQSFFEESNESIILLGRIWK